jgi:tRNA(Arg) A34 adenosine deaminase TadA
MRILLLIALSFLAHVTYSQEQVPASYFVTNSREEYIQKLVDFNIGIQTTDSALVIIKKLRKFLDNYQPQPRYSDDALAKAGNLQALKSVEEGGYGIGAVLVDANGNIIEAAHNEQIQQHRSDLHGEMTLLTKFEESPKSKAYLNSYLYKPGLTVFSSAEPCPMCFIRLSIAGVATRYCTPGPDDGMVSRVNCLPEYWKQLATKHKFSKGDCSPQMQKLAHLLFFSYLLDSRGPKE